PTSSTTTTPTVGPVAALAVSADGSRLYAGGFFTSMAGVARSGLAALDAATGALDAAFNPAPSAGGVEAMVLTASGRLLLGGGFTKIGATARNHLAAVTAATGALDAAWAPSADGAVHTLRLSADGTGVFAGGAFATIGGTARSRPALASAGGTFASVNGTARANLAAFDTTTGALVPGFVANSDKTVRAIEPSADGSSLYVGGLFKKVNGLSRSRLAKLNATTGAVDGA